MNAIGPILIIEDTPKIASLLRDYLQLQGWRVEIEADGAHAVERIRRLQPAAVLLDLMLPGRDGIEICREVRGFSQVPILMVTARVEEIDRLLGLDTGADDYICKPFSLPEVAARLRAVLRRSGIDGAATGSRLRLDEDRFEASLEGCRVSLTAVEFRLLQKLMERPGRIYSRPQLLMNLYSDHRVVAERTVDSHVRNLRRKLAELGVQPIDSVYGAGFRFEEPIASGDP